MPSARFKLSISSDEIMKYYKGRAQGVHVNSLDGRAIQFPANHLRPFVEANGVHGLFEIQYDSSGKFTSLKKIK